MSDFSANMITVRDSAPQQLGYIDGASGPTQDAPKVSTTRSIETTEKFWPYVGLRFFECAVALPLLIFTLPFIIVVAIMIKLDSPGPAFFFQKRLGKGAKPFKFVKFRTMFVDARQRFPDLYAYKYSDEEIKVIRFKVENDPRLTRFGCWLRKTSLDEIPNFWNVLTGEMALVGPRPEIPEMLPYYIGDDLLKFSVRPGITGFAQTEGRGHLSFRDTVEQDVNYVKIRSFSVDIKTLIKTLKMVMIGHGAF